MRRGNTQSSRDFASTITGVVSRMLYANEERLLSVMVGSVRTFVPLSIREPAVIFVLEVTPIG